MIWVTDRILLDQLSWATPARWGYAASASTIDTHRLVPGPTDPKDQHWDHKASAWLFDMAMLGWCRSPIPPSCGGGSGSDGADAGATLRVKQ
ncbi:ABC superfamily ATP binding cassette transporter, ABC domain protein [Mycobacterium kansasii]|uniref:ABC superfamily ATP binding cassette transporter, ABC domain protein n=1 Tax=Mycobacterium kansasii TaxID=1768 RepID=A0A1V3WKW4_MYCKA|nr:ABC superfamily ATP binding cassette transporter, ABC domain protein [Mycobacterium kansasii]